MIVRHATDSDIPRILEMCGRFFDATDYAEVTTVDWLAVRAEIRALMGDGVVLVAEHAGGVIGTIAAALGGPWFNPSLTVAIEKFWWVEPQWRGTGAGKALMAALEEWWPEHADGLLMIGTPNLAPAALDRLYRRMGFRPWDRYHVKFK